MMLGPYQYELTQPRNPHQLVVRQHVQPQRWITNFAGEDGRVELLVKSSGEARPKGPNEEEFVVRRRWEQRAEEFTRTNEVEFFNAMRAVIASPRKTIANRFHVAFSAMYGLWEIRSHLRRNPPPDMPLDAVRGPPGLAPEWTKDEEEQLEAKGFSMMRHSRNGETFVPGRMLTWEMISRHLHETRWRLHEKKWCVLYSPDGDFVCPDQPPSRVLVLPLSPSVCVAVGQPALYAKISNTKAADVNRMLVAGSERFYFSRDLSSCPL